MLDFSGRFRRTWRRHSWLLVNLCAFLFPLLLVPLIDPSRRENQVEFVAALLVYLSPALWAWQLAHEARASLAAEERILTEIERNGRALQDELSRNRSSQPVNEDFWVKFLPDVPPNDHVTHTSVRMVQSLCHEATSGRFPPISTTTQIYSGEITERARRLRAPQTLALRLGILGTFIGLLLALDHLGGLFDSAIVKQLDAKDVKPLVGSMTVAFGTSVAGLLAAILVQLFGEALNVRYERITRQIEDTVGRVVTVLSLSMTGSHLVRTAESLADRMNQHKQELSDHADNVQRASRRGIRAVRGNANALKDGVVALRGSHSALSEVLSHHTSLMGEIRGGLQRLSGVDASLASALKTHLDALQTSAQAIATASGEAVRDSLKPIQTSLLEQSASTSTSLENLSRATARMDELTTTLKELGTTLNAQRDDHRALIKALSDFDPRHTMRPPRYGWVQGVLWVAVFGVLILHVVLLLHVFHGMS